MLWGVSSISHIGCPHIRVTAFIQLQQLWGDTGRVGGGLPPCLDRKRCHLWLWKVTQEAWCESLIWEPDPPTPGCTHPLLHNAFQAKWWNLLKSRPSPLSPPSVCVPPLAGGSCVRAPAAEIEMWNFTRSREVYIRELLVVVRFESFFAGLWWY